MSAVLRRVMSRGVFRMIGVNVKDAQTAVCQSHRGYRRVSHPNNFLDKSSGTVVFANKAARKIVRKVRRCAPCRLRNALSECVVQHFDVDLKMVRQALLDASDQAKFERGVASLLFLLGFNPALQLETDAPDLIVTTPSGRLMVVECTTRIADFTAKVGKLVDRRGALSKHLTEAGHPLPVTSVLVCRLPRDQIATHEEQLRTHNTILVAGEDISSALERLRFPSDPDKMLDEALARLSDGTTSG